MKIFIGLVEVAGRNKALKWGFEQLGHDVTFINLSAHSADYGSDDQTWATRFLLSVAEWRRRHKVLAPLVLLEVIVRIPVFLKILWTHEIFIYSYGSSFFSYWDYRLIKFFRKTLICQFHGSDSRPPYLDGAYVSLPHFKIDKCIADTRRKKLSLNVIGKLADHIIDIPPQGYFQDRPYILRLCVGLPSGPFAPPPPARPSSSSIRLLHAPSSSAYKGTTEIRNIVERLKKKGHSLDYQEITGKKNEEIIEAIRQCDIVLDQLYVDYAMTGLPTEAAWQAKPVITAGYSGEYWKKLLPAQMLPPTVYCKPEEFEKQLEELIVNRELRESLGQQMLKFVQTVHHPEAVAARYLQLCQNDFPSEWIFDPRRQKEVCGGFFMPEDQAKNTVKAVVQRGGTKALQLSDKPILEKAILDWAAMSSS